jgi:hypothetical protein
MNTLLTLEVARHEQEARVHHAMHVRALKAYRRDHPVEHRGSARIALMLRRWATRIDGRTTSVSATR